MSLVATRTETRLFSGFPGADDFGVAPGTLTVKSEFWDHPTLQLSLLIKQTRVTTGIVGEIQREVDEWTYEQPNQAPTLHRKRVYARCWMPGVTHRENTILVLEEHTTYWYEDGFISGTPSYRTIKSGYVIYDLTSRAWQTSDGAALLNQQGKKIPAGETRIIPDSGRPWTPAATQSAIVEHVDANQEAVWQKIEAEVQLVNEGFEKVVSWRYRHDYITGVTTTEGPNEEIKQPLRLELPVVLDPPTITANDHGASGILVEVRGGGGKIVQVWPVETTQIIAPEVYVIYRKTTVAVAAAWDGDPYSLYDTPPASPGPTSVLDHTAVTDLAGAPADPLPAQVSYSESESNTPPAAEWWEQVAEIPNAETDHNAEGHAVYADTDVEAGSTYEYYAVARAGTTESAESNHATVAYGGPLVRGGGLSLRTRVDADGNLEIEVLIPPSEDLAEAALEGAETNYGETVSFEVPALLEGVPGTGVDGAPDGWPAGTLNDAEDLGAAIGLRQAIRSRDRLTAKLTPTAPLLCLERGQRIAVPSAALANGGTWQTTGNAIRMTTELAATEWVLEGYSLSARRQGDSLTVEAGELDLEQP